MALVFGFPTYRPCSYLNRVPRGYDVFRYLWAEMALAQGQEVGKSYRRRRRELSPKGAVKIAFVPLYHYKPEEITLEVDNDNVILHGKHRSEREDGFDTSEFKRVFKLRQEVDPTAITSRATQNGDALIIEGTKRVEGKTEEGKFEAKFDFSGLQARRDQDSTPW